MPDYGTWVSFSGAARIWLAVVLLVTAGGLGCAGTWLPLPTRAITAGRTAVTATLVAWVAAVAAWLVCFDGYVRHYRHLYPAAPAAPPDHVAPVTFVAVAAVFVIILLSNSPLSRTRVASAAIAAMAAPLIFEFPFDLVVMTRTYPPLRPDPAFYRALFFGPLFLIEITTLLLLGMSPMVRLTRATFLFLALMLAVFAAWALAGFAYPSTPVPTALNIASKLLAFAVVLTLFFPRSFPATEGSPTAQERADRPGEEGGVSLVYGAHQHRSGR